MLPFERLSLVTLIPMKIFDWMSGTGSEKNMRLENKKIGGKFFNVGDDLSQKIKLNGECSIIIDRFMSVGK